MIWTSSGRALATRKCNATSFASDAVDALPAPLRHDLYAALLALIGRLQQADRFPEIRACLTCKHFMADAHPDQSARHQCRLVDSPLPGDLLRLDCPEHVLADQVSIRNNWKEIEWN